MRGLEALLVLGLVAMVAPASAQPAPLPGDKAVEQGKQGLELYNQSRFIEAYDRLAAAETLSHSPVFLLYMARAKHHAGDWLAAEALFRKVAAEPLASDAPPAWARAVGEGRAELVELSRAMPSIAVTIRGAERARLTVDGLAVTDTAGVVRCNPGTHLVEAREGERHASTQVEARAGERAQITLSIEPEAKPDHKAERHVSPEREAERGPLAPGIALLAAGGAGLLAGAITGGVAFAMKEDIGSRCAGNSCLESDAEDGATMERLATASTVCFIAGGALAATGIVLVIVRPGGGAAAPQVSLAGSGLSVAWRF